MRVLIALVFASVVASGLTPQAMVAEALAANRYKQTIFVANTLLVANFGYGTIAGFNVQRQTFVDVVRDTRGRPVKSEKIWSIVFGNGASLGDTNTLYFAAAPADEQDGIFGSLCPTRP